MKIENPYHAGEEQVQQRVGEAEIGRRNGQVIHDAILKGAIPFIAQQPMLVLGSLDAEKNVWASALFGTPGFMTAGDPVTLELNISQAAVLQQDPLWQNLKQNSQVGALIIELGSRRRLRINGRLQPKDEDRWRLEVAESYPNCPRYIQRRIVRVDLENGKPEQETTTQGEKLRSEDIELIQKADTFFVASAHPERGVDASHRGGTPGFVQVLDAHTLRVPDYQGNSMFNTLGNFVEYAHAGLVFLDFERQRTLQLIGRPEIKWELDEPNDTTGGTHRYWDFRIERTLSLPFGCRVDTEYLDASPHNPAASQG